MIAAVRCMHPVEARVAWRQHSVPAPAPAAAADTSQNQNPEPDPDPVLPSSCCCGECSHSL